MTSKHALPTWIGIVVAAAGMALLAPKVAAAADVAKEVSTAEQHAGYAAGSKDLKMVQMHLRHVVNCLVGPNGQGFDANEKNFCQGLGAGAIPDTADAAKKKALEDALATAEAGLKETQLPTAQKAATDAQAMLRKAM